MATDRERAEEIALAYRGSSGLADAIATALAQARAEGLRQAAEVAEAHKGAAKRARLAKKQLKAPPEAMNEIYAEERGEDIAAGMIAARLRALAEGGE